VNQNDRVLVKLPSVRFHKETRFAVFELLNADVMKALDAALVANASEI
jgi:hypothetical protein